MSHLKKLLLCATIAGIFSFCENSVYAVTSLLLKVYIFNKINKCVGWNLRIL